MSKSKKVIITLSIVCAVVIIALVTVVSVWAATSQTVTNQLTVRYTATNVSASVKAEYKLAGTSTWQDMGSISFAPTDDSTTKSLAAKEITLTDTSTSVLFRYTFTNDGSNSILLSLDQRNLPTATNINVGYMLTDTNNDPSSFSETFASSNIIAGGRTRYVFIKVEIKSLAFDATYSGTLSWLLARRNTAGGGGSGGGGSGSRG